MSEDMKNIIRKDLEELQTQIKETGKIELIDSLVKITSRITILLERVDALTLENGQLEGKYKIVSDMLTEKMKRIDHLTHVVDRDRYVVAAGITAVESAVRARQWVLQGRGPYEWDDDDYRKEFGIWMEEVYRVMDVLRKVSFDKTDCTTDETKIIAARNAAYEIIKAPIQHREMIAADLGLFDPTIPEITRLRNELKEARDMLKQYEPENNLGYCRICGYCGPVENDGVHLRDDGSKCNYLITKHEPVRELTPEMRPVFLETLVMVCKAHGDKGIDPNDLIRRLQRLMTFDIVIDICQTALERGRIDFNKDAFVIAVEPIKYEIT